MWAFDLSGASRRMASATLFGALLVVAGCSKTAAEPDEAAAFRKAMETIAAGDKVKGLEELNACIEAKPTSYALFERAKLKVEAKDDAGALADCAQGLQLEPTNRDLIWYQAELKKPAAQRFKGAAAQSPRATK